MFYVIFGIRADKIFKADFITRIWTSVFLLFP